MATPYVPTAWPLNDM